MVHTIFLEPASVQVASLVTTASPKVCPFAAIVSLYLNLIMALEIVTSLAYAISVIVFQVALLHSFFSRKILAKKHVFYVLICNCLRKLVV